MPPARALVPLLATLLLAAGAGRAGAERAPVALRALAARYQAHLLADRPDLASRAGHADADERLVPVTEASLGHDAALLRALADSLGRIDRAALSRTEAALFDTLRARIAREAAPLEAGAWRRDPLCYLELTDAAVFESAQRPHVSSCERARRAMGRLRAVPEVLRAAEINLRDHPASDRDTALARWDRALLGWRIRLPAVAEQCHDALRLADFIEADSLALRAATRFMRFLRADSLAIAPGAR
jgi:hypothetical protein